MRKFIIIIVAVILIIVLGTFILIPSEIKISASTIINCTSDKLSSCLSNESNWKRWWPAQNVNSNSGDEALVYKGYDYELIQPYRDGAAIKLIKKNMFCSTRLLILPYSRDSVAVQWQAKLTTSANPVIRLVQYFEAFNIKNNLTTVLNSLKKFAGETQNIYGFHIERTTFTDSILVATRFSGEVYPSVSRIYAVINNLKAMAATAGADLKDHPMMNVSKVDSAHYKTMIAICVNKEIKTDPGSFISRMVVMKNRFLVTEVTGGFFDIQKAHNAINNYMTDHLLSQPGMPFEILITDRSKERDTSKWRTKIVYPSM
ncbi:MAG: hypothetical protein ACTHOF_18555 [Flavisolibacter sp.]|jgi:hypothetical protein